MPLMRPSPTGDTHERLEKGRSLTGPLLGRGLMDDDVESHPISRSAIPSTWCVWGNMSSAWTTSTR
jgi:hypothetical protein